MNRQGLKALPSVAGEPGGRGLAVAPALQPRRVGQIDRQGLKARHYTCAGNRSIATPAVAPGLQPLRFVECRA